MGREENLQDSNMVCKATGKTEDAKYLDWKASGECNQFLY